MDTKPTVTKIMIFHFALSITILFLALIGFSHRSTTVVTILQLPLFAWPLWLFFIGKGWVRALSFAMGLVFSLVMLAGFLFKDENRIGRRRFVSSLGQIYVVQQFDFDGSKELPDKVELERQLPLGFIKTIKGFFPETPSIGEISEAHEDENALELKGACGSYKFRFDGAQLQLVN